MLVDPDCSLRAVALPEPPAGEALHRSVESSLRLLDVAHMSVSAPLLAAVWRAPLAQALPVDFSLFFTGQTGVKKTSLTALAMAHYGAGFSSHCLPSGWESTGNALERLAFVAKDTLLVIDDFCPRGGAGTQRLHREADRVLRAQGNQSGRLRLRHDGALRPAHQPRGLIMASGEDIPQGHSLRARSLIVPIAPDTVRLAKLSAAQRDAADGLYALAMAGYLRWLAPRLDDLARTLPGLRDKLRDSARGARSWTHDRTPDIVANLAVGWLVFLDFARESGAISEESQSSLRIDGWRALLSIGGEQSEYLEEERQEDRFLSLVIAALYAGRAHVVNTDGSMPSQPERWGWRRVVSGIPPTETEDWRACGEKIGWLRGDTLMLDPDIAYAAAQRLARDQGAELTIGRCTIMRRLAERGLISGESSRHASRQIVEGVRRRVLLFPDRSWDIDDSPQQPELLSHELHNTTPQS